MTLEGVQAAKAKLIPIKGETKSFERGYNYQMALFIYAFRVPADPWEHSHPLGHKESEFSL